LTAKKELKLSKGRDLQPQSLDGFSSIIIFRIPFLGGRHIGGWVCDKLVGERPEIQQVSLPVQDSKTAGGKFMKRATLGSQNIQVTKVPGKSNISLCLRPQATN
jgi:hypothetical protein